MKLIRQAFILCTLCLASQAIKAQEAPLVDSLTSEVAISLPSEAADSAAIDTSAITALKPLMSKGSPISIYELPYSLTGTSYDWHRMWMNTVALTTAYCATLFVLEMLPDETTDWNSYEIQKNPPIVRWFNNVYMIGPVIDKDLFIFNYVLHPYAGAAYFMAARSNGFNFYQSMFYSFMISTFGWEFGIEACMEKPSIQDVFVTPIGGALVGECFYLIKRHIVNNDYTLWGSPILGRVVACVVDPVNEFMGMFYGNPTRRLHLGARGHATDISSRLVPVVAPNQVGLALSCTF